MLPSGRDIAVAPLNPRPLWLPTQDLPKIKPIKNSTMDQEGALEAPLQTEELLGVDGC